MSVLAPSRAIVDLGAYRANLAWIRSQTPQGVRLCPVVKAEAYGHGAPAIARCAADAGAHMLAVAAVEEAVALRAADVRCPLLILVQPFGDALPEAAAMGLDVMITDVAIAKELAAHARRLHMRARVHLKVDTGMGRQGVKAADAAHTAAELASTPDVHLRGVATHFAAADAPDDPFTREQIRRFHEALAAIRQAGVAIDIVHAANSAAILAFPETAFDMVRPGLAAYGIWPLPSPSGPDVALRPVLRWETRLTVVKTIARGESVGYNRAYIASEPRRVAIAPVGYADGYRIALSNRAHVLVAGHRCPVLGRVSMDQISVDITDLPDTGPGARVTLIGADGSETVTAADMASWADTIPYEILTGIGPRVARVYQD